MTPQEQLEYERQMAEVIRVRNAGDGDSKLFKWLNSAFACTLLGVLGTAFIGTLITGLVQDRSKRNEMELQARKERSAARNEAVAKILRLLGTYVSSADDLIVIVNNAYSDKGRKKEEVAKLREWREGITKARDKADSDWRQEKGSLGFTLLYLFDDDRTVNGAWTGVVAKADAFEQCTNAWYTENALSGTDKKPKEVCAFERQALNEAMTGLTRAVSVSGNPYK